jgi:hypothetical protein
MLIDESQRTNTKVVEVASSDDPIREVAGSPAQVATFSRQTAAIGEGNRDLLRQEP